MYNFATQYLRNLTRNDAPWCHGRMLRSTYTNKAHDHDTIEHNMGRSKENTSLQSSTPAQWLTNNPKATPSQMLKIPFPFQILRNDEHPRLPLKLLYITADTLSRPKIPYPIT